MRRDRGGAQLPVDRTPPEPDPEVPGGRVHRDPEGPKVGLFELRPALRRDAAGQQPVREGTVERARIEVPKAQSAGDGLGGRGLSRPRGTVQRHDGTRATPRVPSPRRAAPGLGAHATAPRAIPRRIPKKPGKLTSAAPGRSTSMSFPGSAPRTPKAIAMRWSS